MYRISPVLPRFAAALGLGVVVATLWVNLAPQSYADAVEWRLADPFWRDTGALVLTPAAITRDLLMPLYVFFIAKEFWEAVALESGPWRGRRLWLPLAGVAGAAGLAAALWLVFSALWGAAMAEAGVGPAAGWPVPMGSDVVLGYVLGRRVFGAGHAALHLLLVSLVACDLMALVLAGLSAPMPEPARLVWLTLPLLACTGVWWLYGRRPGRNASEREQRRRLRLWPYLLAAAASWAGVVAAGLPAWLGLLPVIPAIPHAARSFGLFAEAEVVLHDPLNRLSHGLTVPLMAILFLFGLTHGGLDLAAFAPLTLWAAAAALLGKPLGYLAGTLLAARLFGPGLPAGLAVADLGRIAALLGLGLTVPVLALETTLPGGALQEAARLGVGLSALAGLVLLALPVRRGH